MGEPFRATAEKGEIIIAEWVRRVVDILRKIKADEILPAAMRDLAERKNRFRPDA